MVGIISESYLSLKRSDAAIAGQEETVLLECEVGGIYRALLPLLEHNGIDAVLLKVEGDDEAGSIIRESCSSFLRSPLPTPLVFSGCSYFASTSLRAFSEEDIIAFIDSNQVDKLIISGLLLAGSARSIISGIKKAKSRVALFISLDIADELIPLPEALISNIECLRETKIELYAYGSYYGAEAVAKDIRISSDSLISRLRQ